MSKEETATKLSEMGYNAVLDSGVIMITVADEKTAKKANKAVKEIGYNSSWGYRIEKNERNNI